ncbi:MAG: glycosyltransferase [Candidatus Binataceae bacterium]
MRILLISEAAPYLPCRDGFRLLLGSLIRELSARHEIHLIAMSDGGESETQANWPRRYCRSCVTIRPAGGISAKFRALSGAADPALEAAASEALRTTAPSVMHAEGPSLASLLRGKPQSVAKVLCVHDSKSMRYREFARYQPQPLARARLSLMAAIARRQERRWFRYADRVVVTSPDDASALGGVLPPACLAVIPSGIDLEHFACEPAPEAGKIVFTGNMSWPPNEDAVAYFAAEVFPKILKRVPGASFWIAGAEPSERVRLLARMSGVHVTGAVPDLRPWLRSASVFVSPMRFGGGVKIKVLEAMASGAPIVSTSKSLSATPLIDGKEALIADHADAMADAVAQLLLDPERGRALSIEARKKVESEYGWPQIAARFERLYGEVIAEHSLPTRSNIPSR